MENDMGEGEGEGRKKKNLILTFPFVEKTGGLFPTPRAATGLRLVFIKQFEVNKDSKLHPPACGEEKKRKENRPLEGVYSYSWS